MFISLADVAWEFLGIFVYIPFTLYDFKTLFHTLQNPSWILTMRAVQWEFSTDSIEFSCLFRGSESKYNNNGCWFRTTWTASVAWTSAKRATIALLTLIHNEQRRMKSFIHNWRINIRIRLIDRKSTKFDERICETQKRKLKMPPQFHKWIDLLFCTFIVSIVHIFSISFSCLAVNLPMSRIQSQLDSENERKTTRNDRFVEFIH